MAVFISFEGIDGCGKSTHLRLLREYLEDLGYEVLMPREPGGTVIGEEIREILLKKTEQDMEAETELLLFLASRAQICRELIEPALYDGKIVICDRFMDSSVAYQGYGRGLGPDLVKKMNEFAVGKVKPDLTFLLDLPVEMARERLDSRDQVNNRLDDESQEFMETVRTGFLEIAQAEPDRIKIISSAGPKADAQDKIRQEIRRIL